MGNVQAVRQPRQQVSWSVTRNMFRRANCRVGNDDFLFIVRFESRKRQRCVDLKVAVQNGNTA
jgi:hypothetical protein